MKIQLPILGQVNVFKKAHRSQLQILKGNKELDIRFRKAHDQVFSEINCLECANCCRTTGPLFDQRDIDRIAKLLHLKPGDFIQQYLHMDEDGDFVLQTVPCPFLGDDNKCLIYEHRPKACREYPHTDQIGQAKIFSLTMKNMEICPAVLEIVRRTVEIQN